MKTLLLTAIGAVASCAYAEDAKVDAVKADAKMEVKADTKMEVKADAKKATVKKHSKKHHAKKHAVMADAAAKCAAEATDAMTMKLGAATVTASGFVTANVNYDVKQFAGDEMAVETALYDNLRVASNRQNDQRRGHVSMHGKYSRLNVTGSQNTNMGAMKAVIEGDFFGSPSTPSNGGSSSSYGFRARHVYGELGAFLVGHTDSVFTNDLTDGVLTTVDPNGFGTLRQLQARYTHKMDATTAVVAVERSSTDYTSVITDGGALNRGYGRITSFSSGAGTGANLFSSNGKSKLPDVTARIQYDFGSGYFNLRGLWRQLSVEKRSTGTTDFGSQNKNAYGFGATLKFKVPGAGSVLAMLNMGSGIGRYITEADGQSAVWGYANGQTNQYKLELQKAYNYVAAYNHSFSDALSAMLGFSHTRVNDAVLLKTSSAAGTYASGTGYTNVATGLPADTNSDSIPTKTTQRLFVNVMYSPVKAVSFGLEYSEQIRKSVSDATLPEQKGRFQRVGFGAWYRF